MIVVGVVDEGHERRHGSMTGLFSDETVHGLSHLAVLGMPLGARA